MKSRGKKGAVSASKQEAPTLASLLSRMFQAHPWHGISAGDDAPELVTSYIEIVPTDTVKYELDKGSGQLRLDRPQRFSSVCPTLYGFIPQTFCGEEVARRSSMRTGKGEVRGDGDPMDICVLSEKSFSHGSFLVRARPIGGLRMLDGAEADDKVIAVLDGDVAYGHLEDVSALPAGLVDRLRHYFLTYKQLPGVGVRKVEIAEVYGRDEAQQVIAASLADYRNSFGEPEARMSQLETLLASRKRGS